jgi:hypothetical protein
MPDRKKGASNDLCTHWIGGRHRTGSVSAHGAVRIQQAGGRGLHGLPGFCLRGYRSSLEKHFNYKIFVSGFFANGIFAAVLCYFGLKLGIDLYYVALIAFGLRIFNNIAIIRRLLMRM